MLSPRSNPLINTLLIYHLSSPSLTPSSPLDQRATSRATATVTIGGGSGVDSWRGHDGGRGQRWWRERPATTTERPTCVDPSLAAPSWVDLSSAAPWPRCPCFMHWRFEGWRWWASGDLRRRFEGVKGVGFGQWHRSRWRRALCGSGGHETGRSAAVGLGRGGFSCACLKSLKDDGDGLSRGGSAMLVWVRCDGSATGARVSHVWNVFFQMDGITYHVGKSLFLCGCATRLEKYWFLQSPVCACYTSCLFAEHTIWPFVKILSGLVYLVIKICHNRIDSICIFLKIRRMIKYVRSSLRHNLKIKGNTIKCFVVNLERHSLACQQGNKWEREIMVNNLHEIICSIMPPSAR